MTCFKLAILAILLVCSIGSSWSMQYGDEHKFGFKTFDESKGQLPDGRTEQTMGTEKDIDTSVIERLAIEMELLRKKNDELEDRLNEQELLKDEVYFIQDNLHQLSLKFEEADADTSVIERLTIEMELLRKKNDELEDRLNEQELMKDDVNFIQDNLHQLSVKFEQIDAKVSVPVSFSSYLNVKDWGTQLVNQTIRFDQELLNDQNAYDNATGVFTAPISGIYVFSYFVVGNLYSVLKAHLDVDGKVVSAATADSEKTDAKGTAGNVAVLHVFKGQKVQVTCTGDTYTMLSDESAGFTTFSGLLLNVA